MFVHHWLFMFICVKSFSSILTHGSSFQYTVESLFIPCNTEYFAVSLSLSPLAINGLVLISQQAGISLIDRCVGCMYGSGITFLEVCLENMEVQIPSVSFTTFSVCFSQYMLFPTHTAFYSC